MTEIYLDNSATTAVAPNIAAYACQLMTQEYGNPSSLHRKGFLAEKAMTTARSQIAAVLGCMPQELIFTSGGTESNNLAILGTAQVHKRAGGSVVVNAAEHASVLQAVAQMQTLGFTVRLVNPLPDGTPDVQALINAVTSDTVLLSCMLVNSETGAIADIAAISQGAKARAPKIRIHCDAVQAFGRIPVTPAAWGVDLLSISGHKLHAPKGVGALYCAKNVRLLPIFYGGGQEKTLRPGTENVPLIGAFGLAAEQVFGNRTENLQKYMAIKAHFENKLQTLADVCINSPHNAVPYIMNISVLGLRSETLIHFLEEQGVYVSSGSACSKGKKSPVLTAMGLSTQRITSALRISFGQYNTAADIDKLITLLAQAQSSLARSR